MVYRASLLRKWGLRPRRFESSRLRILELARDPSMYNYKYMNEIETKKFYDLETALHKKVVRNSREQVSALIADDFLEFGKSGGTFNKQDTLDGLEQEAVDLQIAVSDLNAKELSKDIVLVTYTASMLDEDNSTTVSTNRSSVWILRDVNWQMVFHQGTKKQD